MEFETIYQLVSPHALMSKAKARELYDFIIQEKPREIFEMGFYKGASANLMAAALEEIGGGRVCTYDLKGARRHSPNIEELSETTGLSRYINPVFSAWCAEWELAKIMEENVKDSKLTPYIDFAYMDGGHYWTATGFAFYLVAALLKPGGWILFDDLPWTISQARDPDAEWTKRFPEDVKEKPMVQMVFDLLVRTHPDFCNFRITQDGAWGWAQKKPAP